MGVHCAQVRITPNVTICSYDCSYDHKDIRSDYSGDGVDRPKLVLKLVWDYISIWPSIKYIPCLGPSLIRIVVISLYCSSLSGNNYTSVPAGLFDTLPNLITL